MLAKVFAILIVTFAVIGPGSFLLRTAWKRGGNPRRFAMATLAAAAILVAWLLFPSGSDLSNEARISQFIGAWGILFMAVGLLVIVATSFRMLRERRRHRAEAEHPQE